MKVVSLFLSLAAVSVNVSAFSVQQPSFNRQYVSLSAQSLEVVTGETLDPFDNYQQSSEQELAFKDEVFGSGDVAENGQVVTVKYVGRLMSSNKQFDQGEGYSFRLGEGKVMPGWEKGIPGMRVGGKRTLRIPPVLAYGDKGRLDKIPPNSHLEFECELVSIASNPIEETLAQFNIQKERPITLFLLMILAAAAPTFDF